MKKIKLIAFVFSILFIVSCTTNKYEVKTQKDKNGYSYETVKNDPLKARIYTLDNGLKVYLSVNKDAPRIQTLIAVRAGSTFDPPKTTGLAHYLEHMMFKGSDEIATIDWDTEKIYLEKISDLYEQHLKTDDPVKKKAIYAKIDSLSGIAATFAVANEYDKLVSSMGAKGTNAGTSNELTVYMNDIPTNQIAKWLKLESERFGTLVLRLFHTELETVYEEFNMYQDMDRSKVNKALMSGLFQKHPYGTQTVLGRPEHIKNPSMINIHNYWNTYYVPNNMAMCMAGDLDFEETIKLIDEYWGEKKANPNIPKRDMPVEDPITKPVVKDVYGPDAEYVTFGFRFDGVNTPDEKYVSLIDNILSNSQAGLIDLDLVQEQKVLGAGSYSNFLIDYGMHVFYGNPREGQSLDEVRDLLLAEIEKVKKGEFEDWLIEAVINDLRLSELRQQEGNYRTFAFMSAFINQVDWIDQVKFIDELEKITKEDLVKFANENYKDNYAIVYKKLGEDTTAVKIEKPQITSIDINREAQSEFYKDFISKETESLTPVFVDFKKEISAENLSSGVDFNYIKNITNELFQLNYIIDMGKNNDIELPLAVNYLPYLGTDKYSPSELQQEFFKLGLEMGVSTGNDRSYVYISGLEKSFEKGVELLEHVLANVKPDQKAYDDYIDGILKERSNSKLNKNSILWGGLFNYGKYGAKSAFTNILPEEELKKINPEHLIDVLKDLYTFKHKIFYYGPNSMENVSASLKEHHNVPSKLKNCTKPIKYTEQETNENKVYFVNYDMTQANIFTISKSCIFNKDLIPPARLFGEYYGSGLSSIVFQEIREAKALAYTAFASFSVPSKTNQSNYIYTFVGTQADKIKIATDAMLDLMSNMPDASVQFNAAREAILAKIETERITKANIFWTHLRNLDRGIDYDIRKDVYQYVKNADIDTFSSFFDEYIKDKSYSFMVLGNRDDVDMKILKKLGTVKELTLEEIFNY
ncbi:MAG: insulinase family protein [Bacteroidales bacterium]|nr:insulinase family protein [Bacteroidales bacterium]